MRPEKLRINSPEKNQDYNYLDAKVQEIIYLGDHIRVRFSAAGNDEVIAKIPNSCSMETFSIGDTATLSWGFQYGRAFNQK